MVIPVSEWKWLGNAAHLCVGEDCRFHLATVVGDYLISTVGEYLPDESVREIMANSRKVSLEGRGNSRRASFMNQIGFEEIGLGRKYETMVFKTNGGECPCGCGLPQIDYSDVDMDGYNDAKAATVGHMALCGKWANPPPENS